MIDNFALAVSHGLLFLVAWRLLFRPDLNDDDAAPAPQRGGLRWPSCGRAAASEERPGA
jgi:hypothetical protein